MNFFKLTTFLRFSSYRYGVIEGIKLHREPDTGKSKGFCFLRYRDPRSCALAVDNFNGIELLKRKIRVNHVKDYKNDEEMDVVAEKLKETEEEEDERKRHDKRKKERREEARTVDLMRAAMSQNSEDKQKAIDKERRRTERRQERSERRDDDRDERSRSKRSKDREYDSEYLDTRYRDVKDEYDREGDRHRRKDKHEEDRHHRSHREPSD